VVIAMKRALLFLAACATAPPPPPAAPPPVCQPYVVLVAPLAPRPDVVSPIAPPPPPDGGSPRVDVPVSDHDAIAGSPRALVTLIVFTELECPYCARNAATLAQLRARYQPDELRIVWKHRTLDFHPHARAAAEAAAGVRALAGDAAFWRFTQLAFDHQHELDDAAFVRWAADAGVRDTAAFAAGLADHRWAADVDADLALAERLGIDGVPESFIDGVKVTGAQPIESFTRVIDAELARLRAP
jgi:protein-disulfide isomerase